MMRLAHRIHVAGLSPAAEKHVHMLAMEARSVRTVRHASTTLQQRIAIMATLQSVRLGPQGRPQNGTSLRLQVNCSRIRMLRRANTARFDFNIRLEMGTRCHYTSHQFGERLLVHVEELLDGGTAYNRSFLLV